MSSITKLVDLLASINLMQHTKQAGNRVKTELLWCFRRAVASIHLLKYSSLQRTMNIHVESVATLFTCIETVCVSSITHRSDTLLPASLSSLLASNSLDFFFFYTLTTICVICSTFMLIQSSPHPTLCWNREGFFRVKWISQTCCSLDWLRCS